MLGIYTWYLRSCKHILPYIKMDIVKLRKAKDSVCTKGICFQF